MPYKYLVSHYSFLKVIALYVEIENKIIDTIVATEIL